MRPFFWRKIVNVYYFLALQLNRLDLPSKRHVTKTVLIVGSGIAGALTAKGILDKYPAVERVTLLEAGNVVPQMDRRKWQDYVTTGALPYDANVDEPDEYTCTAERLDLAGSRLFVRGGSTMHWGGWALRFQPEDFRLFSAVGREIDWPYDYDELEPYYALAERSLGISGDSANDRPPRKGKAYPSEAPAFTEADGLIIEGMKKASIGHSHLPIARFANRCMTTGTCKYCPVGGRYAATMTLDELAQSDAYRGKVVLKSGCAVRAVTMRNAKRIRGVEYVELSTGVTKQLEADIVVLCAGAIETPKILLASANPAWPSGVGNRTGHVGRHLKAHPMLYVNASLPTNPGRVHQELGFPTLCSRHFDDEAHQRDGKFFFLREVSAPNIKLEQLMAAGKPLAAIDAATRGAMALRLNGFMEQFSSDENAVGLSSGLTRFGLPRTRLHYRQLPEQTAAAERHVNALKAIFAAIGATPTKFGMETPRADHTTSTVRMSARDTDGVVDSHLRVHGTDNLYVCSNAVFPNIAAVNPTLTLAAVALRFVETLGKDAGLQHASTTAPKRLIRLEATH